MMKGIMMSAIVSVADSPAAGQNKPAAPETASQMVTALTNASKRTFGSPYTVTVKKIEPIAGANQVRVMLFITGEDEPAHDFAETGNQVAAAFFDAGMRADKSMAGAVVVRKIQAVEGGADDSEDSEDSDENSDADALSGLATNADSPAAPTPPQPTSPVTPAAPAGNVPTLPVPPPIPGNRSTTSPSSPVQQPGTTLGQAAGEESANGGPSEHEKPPSIP